MRIALISPYSWSYPGGVTRHVEALAHELGKAGHTATIVTPFDPDDRRALRSHRRARPQRREPPERFVSLRRTVGLKANGAVSNLALSGESLLALRGELRSGRCDIAHLPNRLRRLCAGTRWARRACRWLAPTTPTPRISSPMAPPAGCSVVGAG
jgi:phosphatidylinositol alpha-mannosyltransferase